MPGRLHARICHAFLVCTANGEMRTSGDAGLQFRVSRVKVRVRDKIRVTVRDRVGVRVSDGVRVSTFCFSSHQQPAEARIPLSLIHI